MSPSELSNDWQIRAAELFEKYYEEAIARLAGHNRGVDIDDLSDAFVTALLQISQRPEKFDDRRGTSVLDFLVGAAQRSLLQILRSNRRRQNREGKRAKDVASEQPAARGTLDALADREAAQDARNVAETEVERQVLRLWELSHSDAEIAGKLGLEQPEVKMTRDRLTKRLQRLGNRFEGEARR